MLFLLFFAILILFVFPDFATNVVFVTEALVIDDKVIVHAFIASFFVFVSVDFFKPAAYVFDLKSLIGAERSLPRTGQCV